MPEIGATLREARMRARIDISEIETETKIRAKYLRALENEEWDLLPGPTFVKSFLKTYAEALGLDARLLVEEYKLRHERLTDEQLSRPIGAASAGRKRPEPVGLVSPSVVVLSCLVALLFGIFILSRLTGGDDDKKTSSGAVPATSTATTTTSKPAKKPKKAAPAVASKPKVVKLTLTADALVYVCLRAAGNRTLVRGETLQPGEKRGPFRSSAFVMSLGNNAVTVRANGRAVKLPESGEAIGLRITPKGRSKLSSNSQPRCTG